MRTQAAVAHWLAQRPANTAGGSASESASANESAPIVVRVNAADTEWFAADLALCGHAGIASVMLPKSEQPAAVATIVAQRAGLSVIALIETALGLTQAQALAAAPGVQRLAFGSIDFQVDLGMRGATGDELLPFRTQLVLASRLAGVLPPIDGVSVALDDAAALQADVQRARRLGFGAKLCIHPQQVAAVRAGFAPSADELAWARRVLQAAGEHAGAAFAVDGKMVDKPVILRAQAVLRDAEP